MAVNVNATGVASVHKEYADYADKWARSRAVASGRDAVKAAKETYLPRLKDQTDTEYAAMVKRASYYNASWRTIAGFVGMLFRKEPNVELPETLKPMLDDITMSGVSLHTFAQNLAYEDLTVSRAGILVDHPTAKPLPEGRTVRTVPEAEKEGLRPKLALYKAEAIINWKTGQVNSKTVLIQVRLLETKVIDKNEFETESFEVVRVLDLDEAGDYRQRMFKVEGDEAVAFDGKELYQVYPLMDGQKLKFIPFFIVGPDGIQLEVDEPVLIDLFDVNLDHYVVSASYEQACHITAIPTPYVCGYTKDLTNPVTFYMGSTSFLTFDNPDTQVGMLEYTGQGIDALEKNLARKEAQMAALGARMLAPEKTGVEAADTLAMRHSGENSVLAAIALSVSIGLSEALKVFASWAGIKTNTEIKYELNRDFIPLTADPATIQAWLAMVTAGRMSPPEFLELLKRADLVDAEKTLEEQQAEVDADAIPKPVPAGNLTDQDVFNAEQAKEAAKNKDKNKDPPK